MAPSTRLQVHPERRINYAESSRSKQTRRSTKNVQPSNSVKRERTARVITGAVVKAKAESRMAPKPSISEKNIQPEPEECLLCREMEESPGDLDTTEDACLHFRMICNECVKHMLETKVAQRQLGDVKLECPFPECDYMSDFKTLRRLVDEVAFKVYDIAITRHLLSTDKSYMSCTSMSCGLAFSIEDSKGNKIQKKWIECPYCDFKICMKCHRPWNEHREGSCDQIKAAEDQQSVAKIKEIGAKSCPRCGVKIEKHGGCDHMTCTKCHNHFCWKYLSGLYGQNACECQRAALQNAPINHRKGSDNNRPTNA